MSFGFDDQIDPRTADMFASANPLPDDEDGRTVAAKSEKTADITREIPRNQVKQLTMIGMNEDRQIRKERYTEVDNETSRKDVESTKRKRVQETSMEIEIEEQTRLLERKVVEERKMKRQNNPGDIFAESDRYDELSRREKEELASAEEKAKERDSRQFERTSWLPDTFASIDDIGAEIHRDGIEDDSLERTKSIAEATLDERMEKRRLELNQREKTCPNFSERRDEIGERMSEEVSKRIREENAEKSKSISRWKWER